MEPNSTDPSGASRVRRRALLGTAVLAALVILAGLAAFLTRDGRTVPDGPTARPSPGAPSPSTDAPPEETDKAGALPRPPATPDPVAYGSAAAEALWSYDTRATSRQELADALRGWLTREDDYADAASVEDQIPSAAVWKQMAGQDQHATGKAAEAHIPNAFTRAQQQDPGAFAQAYVYAVTVTGTQHLAWKGEPRGGAEARAVTLAVQCRPGQDCALAGVLPDVAP